MKTAWTDKEIASLVTPFRERTLPRELWTHEAHLVVAYWYVRSFPFEIAVERVRTGIRSYNVACGVPNTETSGYHETLTLFYLRAVKAFLKGRDRFHEAPEAVREMLAALGPREVPFRHFTKERLLSREARRDWVEPDLEPLPG